MVSRMVIKWLNNKWRLMRYLTRYPNIRNRPIVVKHEDLERFCDESSYKRKCPKCKEGVLFVRRDGNLKIIEHDMCWGCGQRFIYSDVEEMRANDWLSPTGGSHEGNKKNGNN